MYPSSCPWTSRPQVLRCRRATRSARPPTQADLTHRSISVGFVVVPCHHLSVPADIKYRRIRSMELIPLPPSPPTLTLTLNSNIPPDIPPDPSLSMLFPENTPYRVPNNPFQGPTSKGLSEIYKKALREALHTVRSPFLFNPVEPYSFDGTCVGVDTSSDSFNSAVTTVIAAIERGYCSNRDPAPLGRVAEVRFSPVLQQFC
ncbi:hypothetical protein F5888DRAFT_945291 [Russula emetica]|nr:hypothetical protein F5888DRAFT_945291 [Russula emetica]